MSCTQRSARAYRCRERTPSGRRSRLRALPTALPAKRRVGCCEGAFVIPSQAHRVRAGLHLARARSAVSAPYLAHAYMSGVRLCLGGHSLEPLHRVGNRRRAAPRSLEPNIDVDRVDLRKARVCVHNLGEAVKTANVKHVRGRGHAAGIAPRPRHGLWRALVVELSSVRVKRLPLAMLLVLARSRIHQNLECICLPVVDGHADQRRLIAEAVVLCTTPRCERRRRRARSERGRLTHPQLEVLLDLRSRRLATGPRRADTAW
jgi:hypothetical protein